jgi:hypothetical protein
MNQKQHPRIYIRPPKGMPIYNQKQIGYDKIKQKYAENKLKNLTHPSYHHLHTIILPFSQKNVHQGVRQNEGVLPYKVKCRVRQ